MVRISIVVLVAWVIAGCGLSVRAEAQSDQSCTARKGCQIDCFGCPCVGDIPPGCYNFDQGNWTATCDVNTRAPGCYKGNAACLNCVLAGNPINLANGNTFIEQRDVSLPGLAGGLILVRTWNSNLASTDSPGPGIFGPNWRSTYEERVFVGDDHYLKYSRGDGSTWSFGYDSTPANSTYKYGVVAPGNGGGGATLVISPSSWPLTFGNGEQRFFETKTGNLVAIIDRNGNKTQISYDSSGRLATITDPVGRHVYFNYPGSGTLVTSVTSDVGLTLTYSYDVLGRLTQVTRPDSSTVNFEYDNNSMITAVKDSQGKILESHTYDNRGRGLSGSRAGGIDAVTISYPQ